MSGLAKKEWIALSIACLGLTVLGLSSVGGRVPLEKGLHQEIGRTLALEAIKLGKTEGKVTIVVRDFEAFPQPSTEIALKSIQSELVRAKREVRSVERIQMDPIRPTEVPSGDFFELLRRLPAGDVIISLMGPPVLAVDHLEKLGRPKAAVVALCAGTAAGKADELLSAGLLHAALVEKPSVEAARRGEVEGLYSVRRSSAL